MAASDADCLLADLAPDQKRREARRRFHVAGGSIRLFLLGVDTAAEMLRQWRHMVRSTSLDAVTLLSAMHRRSSDDADIDMKSVPVSRCPSVLTALAHSCPAIRLVKSRSPPWKCP